jgi:hypothetical protein
MVCYIPQGVYTMQAKRSIVKSNAFLYQSGTKKTKTLVLNELASLLNYHRKHLSVLCRKTGKVYYTAQGVKLVGDPTVTLTHLRGRKKRYTQEILLPLATLWKLAHYCSSIHLVHFIRLNRDIIFSRWPYFKDLSDSIKDRLVTISPATIDRLLKPIKEKEQIKHRYRRNPYASILKKEIPVQPFFAKPKGRLGYIESDLVHHCGETTRGHYIHTLTSTEINTDWTELRALRNRARLWTERALDDIQKTVPFTITDLHFDNGTEFINAHIVHYATAQGINLTRSRDYQKNDSPYVECKNWTMVRSYLGYRRYDTDAEWAIIDELLRLISIRHNYFIPTMKLKTKKRIGAKVIKCYYINLPINRVLASNQVSAKKKAELGRTRESLDYLIIFDRLYQLQKKLDATYHQKYNAFPKDEEW